MGIAVFSGELVSVMVDARWMLLAITVCVLADFRYGWGESSKRYNRAKSKGDKLVMAQYKWRTSRAVRRTINKLVDYFVWVTLGMFMGWAVLRPVGVDHMLGGVAATAVAIACEAKSFCGHFFYLHGIRIEERSVRGFLRAFVVAFAKRKAPDIGRAMEEALQDDNDNSKKQDKR